MTQPQQKQAQVRNLPANNGNMNPVPRSAQKGFLPTETEWKQIVSMADSAFRSGLMPSAVKNKEAVAIIALKAWELEIPFMVGLSQICVINGRPTMQAELIQALARKNHPGLIFNVLETDSRKCVVEGQRGDRGAKPLKLTFTMEDAKAAGLLSKEVWQKWPAAMLRARATTALFRALVPEALMGVSYTPEELGAEVDESGTIVTTGRKVEPVHAPVEMPQKQENPSEDTEEHMKKLRKKMWAVWKGGHGTEEGLRRWMQAEYSVESTQELNEKQIVQICEYVENRLNVRMPVDPEEQDTKQAAPVAEKADWEKESDNSDFMRGQNYDQVK